MIIAVSLVVLLVGLLMYAFARPESPKAAEIGRIMFAFGLLAFLLRLSPEIVTWFRLSGR